MEWKTGNPDKNGQYLVAKELGCYDSTNPGKKFYVYEVVEYVDDLYLLDKHRFPKKEYAGVSGFVDYDSEWGYYEVSNVIGWIDFPRYVEQ